MPNYTLQLLHLADGEAGLLASETAPNLAALVDAFDDGYANTLILAGGDNWLPGPFLAAGTDLSVADEINAAAGSTIALGANIPIGAVDIAIHNVIGVEASAIGNHEFDLGSRVLRDSFSPNLGAPGWVGANFVHVSANLDFSGDADLNPRFTNTLDGGTGTLVQEASALKGRIVPAAVITEGGEKIGIVGATTQILEQISSPTGTEVKGFPTGPGANGEVDNMVLLAAQLQPVIDELIAEGVNKIVLQAHLQTIGNEQQLATLLRGVDIILAAGSNTRLGDADDEAVAFPGHAANFAGTYPLQVTNADGKTTLIVNTDNEYTYLGRLVVEFDANGDIIPASLTANQPINGAYASTAENVAEAWGVTVADLDTTAFADGTKGDLVRDLTDAVQDVIDVKDGNVFGFTNVYLEGERQFVRSQETNLGNLTADANAYAAAQGLPDDAFIVSLKNGGGIRAQIGTISLPDPVDGTVDKLPPPVNPATGKPEGGVSQLDIENSLRFNNRLVAFDTTAQGLLNILNWGAGLPANNGGFPQIGGVKFSFDPDLPGNSGTTPGSRVRDVALVDDNGNVIVRLVENGVVLLGAPSTITVVTLNFTANGGDGYPIKANGENFRFLLDDGTLSAPVDETLSLVDPANIPANALGEQDALGDYLQEFHGTEETAFDKADTPIGEDTRIQNLNFRDDSVFDSPPIMGDDGNNVIDGTAGDDTIDAEGGNDVVDGKDGDDTITGGNGNDSLTGGDGDDMFLVSKPYGDGFDFYDGGAGSDTIDFSGSSQAIDITLRDGVTRFASDTIVRVENIIGTARADEIGGNSSSNRLEGLAGNDEIAGGGGNDLIFGGDGHDELKGGSGDDRLEGGAQNDELQGGVGDDVLLGGDGNDQLEGGLGNDVLIGGLGKDVLNGGMGSDAFVFLAANEGPDRIDDFRTSGISRDTIVLDAAMFVGFTGDDAFDLVGGGFLRAQAAWGNRTNIQIDVDGGGDGFVTLAILDRTLSTGLLADNTSLLDFVA